jgi:hypothetical protein
MPNMADPDLKKAMIERYADNASALFGNKSPMQIESAPLSPQALYEGNMTVLPPDEDYDPETGEVNPGTQTFDAEIIGGDPDPDPEPVWIGCEGEDCGGVLESFKDSLGKVWTVEGLAVHSKKSFNRVLCKTCLVKAQAAKNKATAEAKKAAEKAAKEAGK